jgi:hypothetical protein
VLFGSRRLLVSVPIREADLELRPGDGQSGVVRQTSARLDGRLVADFPVQLYLGQLQKQ